MTTVGYLYSRLLRKWRGRAIRNSRIDATAVVESGSTIINSSIARHSFCGYDCTLLNVDVGAFCSIAGRVIVGGASHPIHFVSTSPVFLSHRDSVKSKFSKHDYLPQTRSVIGNDVWIGDGALIKAGVVVGDGSVIGMGSVVTQDVPPYAIAAGNPARIIRMRFSEDVIAALLKWQWWLLDDEELRRVAVGFDDPVSLLKREGRI
jgi:chloramphenicol O-acetyltransferase type B